MPCQVNSSLCPSMECVTFFLFAIPQYIQDIPNYCLMGTIFILSLDRHRRIKNPEKRSIPIKWALGIVWLVSLALVLPYSAYITFIDLSVSIFTTPLFYCIAMQENQYTTSYSAWPSHRFKKLNHIFTLHTQGRNFVLLNWYSRNLSTGIRLIWTVGRAPWENMVVW